MELEKQVTSMEISKKLKELGVPQDSLFYWNKNEKELLFQPLKPNQYIECAAFTVAELGNLFPPDTDSGKTSNNQYFCYMCDCEGDSYWDELWAKKQDEGVSDNDNFDFQTFCEATEADARGKMLIYLLENHLLDLKGA